jgi:hypothetical protein
MVKDNADVPLTEWASISSLSICVICGKVFLAFLLIPFHKQRVNVTLNFPDAFAGVLHQQKVTHSKSPSGS